jgi:nucleoid-associated protein YgaU
LRRELADVKARLADAMREAEARAAGGKSALPADETHEREKAALQDRVDTLSAELATQKAENERLAQAGAAAEKARAEAEQRIADETGGPTELAVAKRLIENLQAENTRLSDTMEAAERDRVARIARLQRENAALTARLGAASGGELGARPPVPAVASDRVHLVVEGDTLTGISLRYYGTANRWQDIYNANRAAIPSENLLRVGQRLAIP